MGKLSQAFEKFNRLWVESGARIEEDTMRLWFGPKTATVRTLDKISSRNKSAIVLIGVSGIGKSTQAKAYIKVYPNTRYLSYDECYTIARRELKKDGDETHYRMIDIIDDKLLAWHKNNIIIEGMFLHPGTRAALFEVLKLYGYEIHVVYFTCKYVQQYMQLFATKRAIEYALFDEYVKNHQLVEEYTDPSEWKRITENIVQISCKETGMSENQLFEKMRMNSRVNQYYSNIMKNLLYELDTKSVELQEEKNLFSYGADYIYFI